MNQGVRYAIRLSEGEYSDGPRIRRVGLNKAKLWTNIGHVKTHLQGVGHRYPPGATVVEVVVKYQETDLELVATLVKENDTRAKEKADQAALDAAHRELKEAKDRLYEAQRRVYKLR